MRSRTHRYIYIGLPVPATVVGSYLISLTAGPLYGFVARLDCSLYFGGFLWLELSIRKTCYLEYQKREKGVLFENSESFGTCKVSSAL